MGIDEAGRKTNLNKPERILSLVGGGALTWYGLSRKSWSGLALAVVGGALVQRGATGHCHTYAAIGVDTTDKAGSTTVKVPGHGGILVHKAVTINKPAAELYNFWRRFENLPQFMNHLESVSQGEDNLSHWAAKAPAGLTVEWDAATIRDKPNELIAWRSVPGAQVENSGSVRFLAAPEGRGTEVKVTLEYKPPAGVLGAAVAKLFGEEPSLQIEEDLARFKQLMETGETATIEGQPHG